MNNEETKTMFFSGQDMFTLMNGYDNAKEWYKNSANEAVRQFLSLSEDYNIGRIEWEVVADELKTRHPSLYEKGEGEYSAPDFWPICYLGGHSLEAVINESVSKELITQKKNEEMKEFEEKYTIPVQEEGHNEYKRYEFLNIPEAELEKERYASEFREEIEELSKGDFDARNAIQAACAKDSIAFPYVLESLHRHNLEPAEIFKLRDLCQYETNVFIDVVLTQDTSYIKSALEKGEKIDKEELKNELDKWYDNEKQFENLK